MAQEILSVGFIGLGSIGAPMAQRILGAGLRLRVWNRTPGKMQPLLDGAPQRPNPLPTWRGGRTSSAPASPTPARWSRWFSDPTASPRRPDALGCSSTTRRPIRGSRATWRGNLHILLNGMGIGHDLGRATGRVTPVFDLVESFYRIIDGST